MWSASLLNSVLSSNRTNSSAVGFTFEFRYIVARHILREDPLVYGFGILALVAFKASLQPPGGFQHNIPLNPGVPSFDREDGLSLGPIEAMFALSTFVREPHRTIHPSFKVEAKFVAPLVRKG